jgi:hypothetical protein
MIGRKEQLGPAEALFTFWPEASGVFRKQPVDAATLPLDLRSGRDTG